MIDALGIATAGMIDDMQRVATIGQNIANVSTAGYRRQLIFSTLLPETLALGPDAGSAAVSLPLSQVVLDPRSGPLRNTGNPLDLAIEDEGYFTLMGPDGPVYSREGSFHLDLGGRLVSLNGLPVQGASGDIVLSGANPRIDSRGQVFEDNKQVAQVSLAYFPGGTGLQGLGNGQYTAVAAPAAPPGESRIRQGYLEGANAQPMADMVALIDTMRHFEMNQKVIQTIDELQDRSIRGLGEF